MATLGEARKVKNFLAKHFQNDPNFIGIGLPYSHVSGAGHAVKINFHNKPINWIPRIIEEVSIFTEIVGKITKK